MTNGRNACMNRLSQVCLLFSFNSMQLFVRCKDSDSFVDVTLTCSYKIGDITSVPHVFVYFVAEVQCKEKQQVEEGIRLWQASGLQQSMDHSAVHISQVVLSESDAGFIRGRVEEVKDGSVVLTLIDKPSHMTKSGFHNYINLIHLPESVRKYNQLYNIIKY